MTRKRLANCAVMLVALILVRQLVLPTAVRSYMIRRWELGPLDGSEARYVALVTPAGLRILTAEDVQITVTRLTRMSMQTAQPPESEELILTASEGNVVIVQGYDAGGWIYSAQVIDMLRPHWAFLARIAYPL